MLNEELRKQEKKKRKGLARKKNNAMVLCADGSQYWTTQNQFWQWGRDRGVVKQGDYPLRGKFRNANEERTVVLCNTVLNLSCPNHLREVLLSQRLRTR